MYVLRDRNECFGFQIGWPNLLDFMWLTDSSLVDLLRFWGSLLAEGLMEIIMALLIARNVSESAIPSSSPLASDFLSEWFRECLLPCFIY